MTGLLGSVLFVLGSMFAYMGVVRDAGLVAALSALAALSGLWLCRRSGVF